MVLPCLTITRVTLFLGGDNFAKRTGTATRPYNKYVIYCNKWFCNVIELSFQCRNNTNIRKSLLV